MRLGSLFTGYGGLDAGVRAVLGGSVAWHTDNDPAAARLLAHHWPETTNLGDITGVDWSSVEPVEVVTGGWPCQPWSVAGRRKGAADDRALWPEVARALRALRPRLVVLENVPGIVAAGELARVAGDLAALGYRFAWTRVGAAEVGAPHRRERIFIVAAEDSDLTPRVQRREPAPGEAEGRRSRPNAGRRSRAPAAHTSGQPFGHKPAIQPRRDDPPATGCQRATAADTDDKRPADERQVTRTGPRTLALTGHCAAAHAPGHRRGEGQSEPEGQQRRPDAEFHAAATAADDRRCRGHESKARPEQARRAATEGDRESGVEWGAYGAAIQRWGLILGRQPPAPTQVGSRGGAQLSPSFVEFMMGLDAGHVCDVPDLSRVAQLRLLGNGVVPQQAAAAVTWLLEQLGETHR